VILVTGATGKVGGETVRVLAADRVPVRAFVRSVEKAEPLAAAGAEIAVGDLDDAASLEAALADVMTVVLVTPGDPTQEISVIDAAVRAGVRHVVYLTSKASLDAPIERRRWHAQVEAALAESGLAHTLLRSNAYMQNTLALAPVIAATGGFASSAANGRMGMIDTRDVAAVAATVAANPASHAGSTHHLTGPAAISYPEVAQTLAELLSRPVKYEAITSDDERARMIARGVPEPLATMNAQAFTLNAGGDADWVTDDVATITGRSPRTFRAFAIDHLKSFDA
jgi:uncharacterized protein YbjT (DUF2867 family)